MRKEWGDFQTPPALVEEVLQTLHMLFEGKIWSRALEPTCGIGNFIAGLLALPSPPQEILGYDLQEKHLVQARKKVSSISQSCVRVSQANIFDLDLRQDVIWQENGVLLVIGNPPWVTNAVLGTLESENLPQKTNFKNLSGINAQTGDSNFDIAEYIWIKLIRELATEGDVTLALLCKTSTARNVLKYTYDAQLPVTFASIHRIEAKKWFDVAVDAGLFCVTLGSGKPCYEARVYKALCSPEVESIIGIANGKMVSDIETYKAFAFGESLYGKTWRQGIKHDAAAVMELHDLDGFLLNKLGETVNVEQEYVYPLLKSSDVFHQSEPRLQVIVPQRRLGENTAHLKTAAPRLWTYLTAHQSYFEKRKSSIYQDQPPFAIFGIGEYSFAPYKVAVAGLYKTPRFYAVGLYKNRPVMLDDTCYFLACQSPQQAAFLACLLNSPMCLSFLNALVFRDAKRPITKKILQQLDLGALLNRVNREELFECAEREVRRLTSSTVQWPRKLEELLVGL